jgi:hypothetical protein
MSTIPRPVVAPGMGAPLMDSRQPRCPPYKEITESDDLLPYMHAVAKRTWNHGIHPAWELRKGDRILLYVDNWHDELCIEAAIKVFEAYNCNYTIRRGDRGPIRSFTGEDEVPEFFALTQTLVDWFDEWERLDATGDFDRIIWGIAGPVFEAKTALIGRWPFITREMCASPAHLIPSEVLKAIDDWTWDKMRQSKRVRITDVEGTDVSYTNHDAYWDSNREFYDHDLIQYWHPRDAAYAKSYIPGHISGKPSFYLPKGVEDGTGVIVGTGNHIGPHPYTKIHVENSTITRIEGGGKYGRELNEVLERTAESQYPGLPGKGLLHWWEAAIGTNPKVHRPRLDYGVGAVNGLYDRVRSGVVHIGMGSVISSGPERESLELGLPTGHFHIHLYFPTIELEMLNGDSEIIIDNGHLLALDDPEVRAVAARFGDPDEMLREDWIPAVPGINMHGDYFKDYAHDPVDWTLSELKICRKWHDLFLKMTDKGGPARHCH